MITVKMSLVARQWMDVSTCPYCGSEPEVTTSLGEAGGDVHHEAVCGGCGMSAPLPVWNAIGRAIKLPLKRRAPTTGEDKR